MTDKTTKVIEELSQLFRSKLDMIGRERTSARYIRDLDEVFITSVILSSLRRGMQQKSGFTTIAAQIGKRLRMRAQLDRDEIEAVKVGAFFLIAMHEAEWLKIYNSKPKSRDGKYMVHHTLRKYDLLGAFSAYKPVDDGYEVAIDPYEPWINGVHNTGRFIMRFRDKHEVEAMDIVTNPLVFKVINDKQSTGWLVDSQVLDVYNHFFLNEYRQGSRFPFSYQEPDLSGEQRAAMREEASIIGDIANSLGDYTFYHMYNMCFRGRIYPTTLYFNEQSSDNAKGLLRFADKAPLRKGHRRLLEHIANCWGWDKEELDKKYQMALEAESEWISYANDPYTNMGWMDADKAWSFLQGCFELKAIQEWTSSGNPIETFMTSVVCYIDGANNGLQHIAAATKDPVVGSLVNLIPSDTFADAYMYMADSAYEIINQQHDPQLDELFKEARETMYGWGERIEAAKDDEEKFKLITKAKEARKSYPMDQLSPNYWLQQPVYDKRRKTVKRPVMTLGYGGTEYGFMKQIVEDTNKFGKYWAHMEYAWAGYLGSLIYDLARGNEKKEIEAKMPGLAKALNMYETLAERSSSKEEHLSWTVPVTNLKVCQRYRKATTTRIKLRWDGSDRWLNAKLYEVTTLDKAAEKTRGKP